jgi:hypothetical protein
MTIGRFARHHLANLKQQIGILNSPDRWVRSSGRGAICSIECQLIKPPPTPQLTAHHPPSEVGYGGEQNPIAGEGGWFGFASSLHHSGAAPALRSFRLLPASVAPLTPLRHHYLRVQIPQLLRIINN